jgi:lysozyme
MQTSARGIDFLKRHEGVVLRAYRCPAGVWTIGAGLTRGSGVVDPTPGMVITAEEADRLLAAALTRNYEPRVARAMAEAQQHEFDAGVSFDFNTGAIHRASWVTAWARRGWDAVGEGLMRWTRGGGKVLPGLVRRRTDELVLMRDGDYGLGARWPRLPGLARVTLDLSAEELEAARAALDRLGYAPGSDRRGIAEAAVRAFQERHGLTVDGILGRATLSTLQRELDARGAVAAPTAGVVMGAGESIGGVAPDVLGLPSGEWLGPALVVLGLAAALWLAWRYRDVVAAAFHPKAPRFAAWLRSF